MCRDKIAVKEERCFIFNDINVDRFINCYASSHNLALLEGKCSIEVHSSPFLHGAKGIVELLRVKVTHGLVELLRVAKIP